MGECPGGMGKQVRSAARAMNEHACPCWYEQAKDIAMLLPNGKVRKYRKAIDELGHAHRNS